MCDRMRDGNIDFKWSESCKKHSNYVEKTREAHLIDVFQFVNDLIYHRVSSLHLHFRVGTLSLDATAHHTQCVAVNKRETVSIFINPSVMFKHNMKNHQKKAT